MVTYTAIHSRIFVILALHMCLLTTMPHLGLSTQLPIPAFSIDTYINFLIIKLLYLTKKLLDLFTLRYKKISCCNKHALVWERSIDYLKSETPWSSVVILALASAYHYEIFNTAYSVVRYYPISEL